jgi:hypothetical protein
MKPRRKMAGGGTDGEIHAKIERRMLELLRARKAGATC